MGEAAELRPTLTLESHFGEWQEGVYVTVSNGPHDSAIYQVVRCIGLGSWQLEHRPEAEGRITVRESA